MGQVAYRPLVFLVQVAAAQAFCDGLWTCDIMVEIVGESPADDSLCLGNGGVERGTGITELECRGQ